LGLKLEITYRSGNGRNLLLHYNYGAPDVYLIIALENGVYFGHILFDLGAEYRPSMISSPHLAQVQEATENLIEQVVAKLPHQSDPYVILETGEGTYMQALWTKEGFVLEHQLVTLSCHYETRALVTHEQVIAALKSYAFGKYDWTTAFSWRLMKL
jgi:hypothetical protein